MREYYVFFITEQTRSTGQRVLIGQISELVEFGNSGKGYASEHNSVMVVIPFSNREMCANLIAAYQNKESFEVDLDDGFFEDIEYERGRNVSVFYHKSVIPVH